MKNQTGIILLEALLITRKNSPLVTNLTKYADVIGIHRIYREKQELKNTQDRRRIGRDFKETYNNEKTNQIRELEYLFKTK